MLLVDKTELQSHTRTVYTTAQQYVVLLTVAPYQSAMLYFTV